MSDSKSVAIEINGVPIDGVAEVSIDYGVPSGDQAVYAEISNASEAITVLGRTTARATRSLVRMLYPDSIWAKGYILKQHRGRYYLQKI